MATSTNIEDLLEWFRDPSNKSFWNEDLLEIRSSAKGGVGVFARQDIEVHSHDHDHEEDEEDECCGDETPILLRVSKECILSAKTSKIGNFLMDGGLSGMQALILAFLYEKADSQSPWKPYCNSINIHNSDGKLIKPPCMWNDKDKESLKGTEAEILGVTDPEEIENFFTISLAFAREVEPFVARPLELDIVGKQQDAVEEMFEHFSATVLAVSSRAFTIDEFHGLALVPGADLFNHDPYNREHVHFETLAEVCPFCGKDSGCGHSEFGAPDSEEESEEEDEEEEESEEESQEEFGDEFGREEITELTEDVIAELENNLEQKEDESESESSTDEEIEGVEKDRRAAFCDPDTCCDIRLVRSVNQGEEIFNTYGELANPFLLSGYLFVSKENPNDTVGLGRQVIKTCKNHRYAKHVHWWEKTGYAIFKSQVERIRGEEEEEREEQDGWKLEMKLTADGMPTPETYAFARLLSLSHIHLKRAILQRHKLYKTLTIRDPKAYRLLLQWCQQRLAQYPDAKPSKENRHLVKPLVDHEKQILERGIAFCKSQ